LCGDGNVAFVWVNGVDCIKNYVQDGLGDPVCIQRRRIETLIKLQFEQDVSFLGPLPGSFDDLSQECVQITVG